MPWIVRYTQIQAIGKVLVDLCGCHVGKYTNPMDLLLDIEGKYFG